MAGYLGEGEDRKQTVPLKRLKKKDLTTPPSLQAAARLINQDVCVKVHITECLHFRVRVVN